MSDVPINFGKTKFSRKTSRNHKFFNVWFKVKNGIKTKEVNLIRNLTFISN